jgi:hypothetical protein
MPRRATEGRCSRYTAYEPVNADADAISINAKPLSIASKLNNIHQNNSISPFHSLITRLTSRRTEETDIWSSTTCFLRFELLVGACGLGLGPRFLSFSSGPLSPLCTSALSTGSNQLYSLLLSRLDKHFDLPPLLLVLSSCRGSSQRVRYCPCYCLPLTTRIADRPRTQGDASGALGQHFQPFVFHLDNHPRSCTQAAKQPSGLIYCRQRPQWHRYYIRCHFCEIAADTAQPRPKPIPRLLPHLSSPVS